MSSAISRWQFSSFTCSAGGKLWNIIKFMNCNLHNFQLRECAAADGFDSLCWADGEGGLAHGDGAGGGGRQEERVGGGRGQEEMFGGRRL